MAAPWPGSQPAFRFREWAKKAVIAEFGNYLGGMTSGGLGATDIGNKSAIGGISLEFYHRVALHYSEDASWHLEDREASL